jgi:hypothetical protein
MPAGEIGRERSQVRDRKPPARLSDKFVSGLLEKSVICRHRRPKLKGCTMTTSAHKWSKRMVAWFKQPKEAMRKTKRRRGSVLPERPRLEQLETRFLPAGTWSAVTNLAPDDIGTMMLLSDGTVMAQNFGAAANENRWYRLTPNASGSYAGGTWSNLASMNLQRLYYGSNVLPDGRVFVMGGEFSGSALTENLTNTGEIYNPVANTWSTIATFPQTQFGDDPTQVLADGRILAGYRNSSLTYLYNPSNNSWSLTGTKLRGDPSGEETWLKLPDGSILSYDVWTESGGTGHAQRYIPSSGTWVDAGTVPTPSVTAAASWAAESGSQTAASGSWARAATPRFTSRRRTRGRPGPTSQTTAPINSRVPTTRPWPCSPMARSSSPSITPNTTVRPTCTSSTRARTRSRT